MLDWAALPSQIWPPLKQTSEQQQHQPRLWLELLTCFQTEMHPNTVLAQNSRCCVTAFHAGRKQGSDIRARLSRRRKQKYIKDSWRSAYLTQWLNEEQWPGVCLCFWTPVCTGLTMNVGGHVETSASQIIHINAVFQVIQNEKKIQFAQMVNPQLKLKDGPLLSKV